MKTFITEQQLALYKYQPQSRYYNWSMANIVYAEWDCFMKQISNNIDVDIIGLFEHFLHKKIAEDTWQYYFFDGSILTIAKKYENNQEKYYFSRFSSGFEPE